MILFVIYIFLCLMVGAFSETKERFFVTWTIVSLIISPFFAFILLLCLPDLRYERMRREEMIMMCSALRGKDLDNH